MFPPVCPRPPLRPVSLPALLHPPLQQQPHPNPAGWRQHQQTWVLLSWRTVKVRRSRRTQQSQRSESDVFTCVISLFFSASYIRDHFHTSWMDGGRVEALVIMKSNCEILNMWVLIYCSKAVNVSFASSGRLVHSQLLLHEGRLVAVRRPTFTLEEDHRGPRRPRLHEGEHMSGETMSLKRNRLQRCRLSALRGLLGKV